MIKEKLNSSLVPLGIFFLVFFVYIHNLSVSVYGGDSGDFLSAIVVKGIPHPSGFPLYMILGILFNSLPFHQSPAWKVGLLSTAVSLFSVVIMYAIVAIISKSKIIATITSLSLAFLFPFWLFAEVSEIYALHSFFLLLLFYLGLLLYSKKQITCLYLLAVVMGLSLANDQLALIMLPSLLIFAFSVRKKIHLTILVSMRCIGLFFLGLSPYLYIPLAAAHNPPINWEHGSSIVGLFQLVTRSAYGWSGGGTGIFSAESYLSLQNYLRYLYLHIPLVVVVSILFGVIALIKQKKWILLSTILLNFLLFGPIFSLYTSYVTLTNVTAGINEKFYIASILFLLLFSAFGIKYIVSILLRALSLLSPLFLKKPLYVTFFTSLFLLSPFFLYVTNRNLTDLHTIKIGDNLGKDVLSSLPHNSAVWVTEDDNIPFDSRYMQYAYGIRQDVHVFAGADLKNIKTEQMQLHTFPYGDRSNPPILYGLYLSRMKPTFIMLSDYNELNQRGKSLLFPYGLLLKVADTQEKNMDENTFLKKQSSILHSFRQTTIFSSPQLLLLADVPVLYANAYANTGNYLISQYNDYDRAKPYFEKALRFSPDSDSADEGLGDYFLSKNSCERAKDFYISATEVNILNLASYHKLYGILTSCLPDKVEAEKLRTLASKYPELFKGVVPSD